MSIAAKKRIVSDEVIERLKFLCNNRTLESRLKVSEKHKGNKYRLGIPHTAETLKVISDNSKKYIYTILDKNEYTYRTNSLSDFCKKHDLTPQLLGNTFRGYYANGEKCNHHKGFKIIFKEKKQNEKLLPREADCSVC